jgi:nucleotide-binding universal stress UspA family protein
LSPTRRRFGGATGDPMIKTILVPSTGSDRGSLVSATALAVARRFAAHLDFLHVRVDAAALAVAMTADGGPAMLGGLTERLEEEADRREAAAKQQFHDFCRREQLALRDVPSPEPGPSAGWRCEVGREKDWVAAYGRAADLIVVGRPADGEDGVAETIEAALLDSGRPLLIPGTEPMTAIPETIVIAWKPTREAARAVAAAMPLLAVAKDIHILTVAEDAAAGAEHGPLATALRWHGFRVAASHLPAEGSVPDTMLAAARERSALLVMGGYGHSRLSQWIFGGFTRRVLAAAEVPVLIAH